MAGVREDAAAIAAELTELRRSIHAEPEIGLDLPLTQRKVLDALDGLPLEISLGQGLSSVTAVLRGAPSRQDGPAARRYGCAARHRAIGRALRLQDRRGDARLRA